VLVKRIIYISIFFLSHTITGRSQSYPNLVPNPSFADIISCTPGCLYCALSDWYPDTAFNGFWGTSDMYHSCNGYAALYPGCGVVSLDGDGFIAQIYNAVVNQPQMSGAEFAGTHLIEPLQPHQNYCVSFYKNYCFAHQSGSTIFNNMCVGFFDQLSTFEQPVYTDYFAFITHYVEDTLTYDTIAKGWQKVEYNYTADGTENWILLGILGDNNHVSHIFLSTDTLPGYAMGAYIFWDSIVVRRCHDEISMNIDNLIIPNVITANGDGMNDDWILHNGDINIPKVGIEIYNRWGEIIYTKEDYHGEWHGQNLNDKECSEGIYYYRVTLPPDQQRAGFVTVFR
jgi:gliding motility-associated-like protein